MNKLKPKNNKNMNILKTIELKLESVFNIMAFIRTLVAIIFIYGMCISCCLIVIPPFEISQERKQELVDSYDKHIVHFHEMGIELPTCEWCSTYSGGEEDDDAE